MGEMDERLIAALRHDVRASLSDFALQLKLSRTTVRARIERLQARGDILGFSVVMKQDVLRDPVRALMMISIEGRGASRITRQIHRLTEVWAIHSTNRRWDLIVELGTETLDTALAKIRTFDGVVNSETSILLSTKCET
jgi:DNA-binding Lrp family transcriptional regulator